MADMMFTTDGNWVELDVDPVSPAGVAGAGFDEELGRAGYGEWAGFPAQEATPIRLEITRHEQPSQTKPMFRICVCTAPRHEVVYAESVPALMQLLSLWVPAVQGAAVGQLLGDLDEAARKGKTDFPQLLAATLKAAQVR